MLHLHLVTVIAVTTFTYAHRCYDGQYQRENKPTLTIECGGRHCTKIQPDPFDQDFYGCDLTELCRKYIALGCIIQGVRVFENSSYSKCIFDFALDSPYTNVRQIRKNRDDGCTEDSLGRTCCCQGELCNFSTQPSLIAFSIITLFKVFV